MAIHRNNWDALTDDLAERILARLPTPSVVASRCVCRRWLSLVSSPGFVAIWAAAAPRSLWFLIHGNSRTISAWDHRTSRWFQLPLFDLCALDPSCSLPLASAGGLICFRDRSFDNEFPVLTICNPISGARHYLPRTLQIQYIDIIGMTADRDTNSYTVLITGKTGAILSESITEVYDSRTGHWVQHCPYGQQFLQSFCGVRAVWYEGSFYCLSILNRNLIAYDLGKREWTVLSVSMPLRLWRPSLLVSGGKLLLAGKNEEGFFSRSICVWELEKWQDDSQWALVDTMPNELFHAMRHNAYSTSIRCQGLGDMVCFSTNRGWKSVIYDVTERKWQLLPENQRCSQSQQQSVARNNLVGLPYEPSLSARV